MSTGGGSPVRLTNSPADDMMPRWSPDGRNLVFASDHGQGTDLYLIPPLGGQERKLVETRVPAAERLAESFRVLGSNPWSPDGQEVLFSRLESSGQLAVWKVNVTTGQQAQVTFPPPGAADRTAAWSFDGTTDKRF